MAATATAYGNFLLNVGKGSFDFTANTIKVLLTTSSYTPNIDTHALLTDISHEVSATGYTAGGATLASVTWTYDSTNNWAVLAADSVLWTSVSLTARYGVVYKSTGTGSTSLLIGFIDFGADKSPSAEDFVINFATGGVMRLKVG